MSICLSVTLLQPIMTAGGRPEGINRVVRGRGGVVGRHGRGTPKGGRRQGGGGTHQHHPPGRWAGTDRVPPQADRVALSDRVTERGGGGVPFGHPPPLGHLWSYGLGTFTIMIRGSESLEKSITWKWRRFRRHRGCVAQWAFVRSIQKMLRWGPITGRGPLRGVGPHTQVRRVYEGEGQAEAETKSSC